MAAKKKVRPTYRPRSELQELSSKVTWFIHYQLHTYTPFPWFMQVSTATKEAYEVFRIAKKEYIRCIKSDYMLYRNETLRKRKQQIQQKKTC